MPPIDLLVVDGPPEQTAPLAREPALPRLLPRMATRWTVLLDDADRPDETEIVRRWLTLAPRSRLSRPPAEKGLAVLRSDAL